MRSSESLIEPPTTGIVALLAAVAGVSLAAANQVDYTGTVSLGTALILLALGAVTLYNRFRNDTSKMLRESVEDWRSRCEELTAQNRELAARPDTTTVISAVEMLNRVIETLAQGSSEMSRQILEAIKAQSDLVIQHDHRAHANMDRLAELIATREQRFRNTDR